MKIIRRIGNIFVGLVLITTGAGIIYAFYKLKSQQHVGDIWDNGFLLIDEAYSIVGSLFILFGLRCALGQNKFIEQKIAGSLRHFALTVLLLSLAILIAVFFASR
ncbi:MAG TPA: hypothetical protein VFC85_06005 [Verrucomicrobiae bacterium]|nr:hypothetical protein [Verrucomicrobiae bacterium]